MRSEVRDAANRLVGYFKDGQGSAVDLADETVRVTRIVNAKTLGQIIEEAAEQAEMRALTENQQVLAASMRWLGSAISGLDGELLQVAFDVPAAQKQNLEEALGRLSEGDRSKLVALISRDITKLNVKALPVIRVQSFKRIRPVSSAFRKTIANPRHIPFIRHANGEGAAQTDSHRYLFNVSSQNQDAGFDPALREILEYVSETVIGAVAAKSKADNPGAAPEQVKKLVAEALFKQYPEYANGDVVGINRAGDVVINQSALLTVAFQIARSVAQSA
jgi:hypothetical protein